MKNQTKKTIGILITAIALTATTQAVRAADQADDPWRFGVTVPLWAPQIDGDVEVRGNHRDVNVSFSTLRDHLDAAFSLGLDARKGKFDIYGDVGYMKFSGGGGIASFDLKFVIADAGVAYRLVKTEGEHPFVLEGTAGLRYWYTDTTLTLSTEGRLPLQRRTLIGSV